jgi:hypothetical protein
MGEKPFAGRTQDPYETHARRIVVEVGSEICAWSPAAE